MKIVSVRMQVLLEKIVSAEIYLYPGISLPSMQKWIY